MNSLSGKTVLVTGSAGFIGSHLVKRLLKDKSIRIVLLTRRPVPERSEDVIIVTSSLEQLSPETWQKAELNNINIVFHLGAFTPKLQADIDRVEDVFRDNLEGTRVLLDSLPAIPEKLIFSSTIDVYAQSSYDRTINEASPLGTTGFYGASKVFCEQMIEDYINKHSCSYAILRYGHIFGPGEGEYEKLIPNMIRNLLHGEVPVLYGDGSAERDYLYVGDAVEATMRAAVSPIKRLGPINIVRGKSVSIKTIAELLITIIGFNGSVEYLSDKPAGYSLRFNNKMMIETLGEWDLVSIEEGLRQEVDYFRSLGR